MTPQPDSMPAVTMAQLFALAQEQAAQDAQAAYDVDAGLARFTQWLAERVDEPTYPAAPPTNSRRKKGERLAEVRFLTVAEVAAMMRVSRMTVYRLIHDGVLPAIRVGRSFQVPEKAALDYLRYIHENDQAI